MKEKIRPSLLLSMVALLIVVSLAAGCYRQAAPDVTPTSAAGADTAPAEEGTPDLQALQATAIVNATLAAQAAEETATAEQPTAPPPTPTSTMEPTAEITAAPTFTPVPAEAEAEPTATPSPTGEVKHTVQPGENLFRIALRYGTTVEVIASANGIANPARIYVGQVLTIASSGGEAPSPPAGDTYVVQPGDNLFRIALRYNMSYFYLAQYNGIANPAHIYVGQILRIPPR